MKKILLTAALMLLVSVSVSAYNFMTATAPATLPIVTTPSPTTYPIHWYQLKINDKYVYYAAIDGYDQACLTVTPSTDDAYLWCFVQTSSGKILVYNKAIKKYLEYWSEFTDAINSDMISYLEEGSGNDFYICFNDTYYLNEYIDEYYDKLACGSFDNADTFNAILD